LASAACSSGSSAAARRALSTASTRANVPAEQSNGAGSTRGAQTCRQICTEHTTVKPATRKA
jgi:hypothetical protein